MAGPWVVDVPGRPVDGNAILGMVGAGINSSKFEISPEKVDDALGSSALLAVSGDDGGDMMIDNLVPKKYSASSGDDQALSLEGQSWGEPTS
jgi:hypothetical protein